MDKCEARRNHITLAAVKAQGEPLLKCCVQMYHSLALITKGSVRTLVRSGGESRSRGMASGAHKQHSQYALMQKIMMLAKPWCDHAEGFESGLIAWELDVGDWERAPWTALADAVKYTVMMNIAPIFLRNSLQLGTHANSTALRTALFAMVLFSPKLRNISDRTSADDDNRMQVDSLKKGKGKVRHKQHRQRRHQHLQELW